MIRRPPRSPLFPSTPLSRSLDAGRAERRLLEDPGPRERRVQALEERLREIEERLGREVVEGVPPEQVAREVDDRGPAVGRDRKSTRLNSSHLVISYAVFCLK